MSSNPNAPIGIIDSGIGGLTVARALQQSLPNEAFVFFGDTAHVPYGDKSPGAIRSYTEKIIHLLFNTFECKLVIVACNTASAIAAKSFEKWNNADYPVVNVIDPVVKHVALDLKLQNVGVIGTKRTIDSRAYPYRIKKLNPSIKVFSRATPLLAPMIEEGFFNNNISRTIIHEYLSWQKFNGIEAIIPGCTHYPHIRSDIEKFFAGRPHSVKVIESADIVARYVRELLQAKGIESSYDPNGQVSRRFYVSDYTKSFQKTTLIFFGKEVTLNEWPIWKTEKVKSTKQPGDARPL